jgi:hypothetical protein
VNQAEWYGIYKAAIFECDPTKLATRIREAESAISIRLQGLAQDSDCRGERKLISDALFGLRTLQRPLLRHN